MNDERNDGGPAFPVADYDHQTFSPKTVYEARRLLSGMSLRDYFAAKAMQAFISRADIAQAMSDYADGFYDEKVAQWSYETADAMLKARES